MKKAILATKVGMTQIFNADGVLVPVTVLEAGPCSVTQIKTVENDGYSAVQVAYADKKEKVVSKDANGKKEIRNRHGVNKAQMGMHPSIGYAILADYDYDQTVLDAVLYHHEHYDGTGYPHNLVGKQIPLVGRIMHVCDIFGALISNRDYREGFDVETALDIMIDEVKNFDMKVFLAFQRVAFSDGVMETVIGKGNLDDLFEEEQQ